ncbi:NAD(P)-binding domain-containing protein [Streptomyces pristinaespiralis]|uniref:NAD(P)-binding domain-containing protein n=1 Tax=Streptomyces pristinaespiralis TaxID=38300 RepID=UPI0033E22489
MYDLAVIGAGPYGLSVAAHAAAAGMSLRVFGRTMESWRDHMPEGMFLKSEPWASDLSDPGAKYTLADYAAVRGFEAAHGRPLPIADFAGYGMWFAEHAAPPVEERTVTRVVPSARCFRVETSDGDGIEARTVALAVGIMPFRRMPEPLAALPPALCSHSSGHLDPSAFGDLDVTVVGAGQAALETATLLAEHGARPQLVARADRIRWNTVPLPRQRGRLSTLRTPLSGLGSGWTTWAWSRLPGAVGRLPAGPRERLTAGSLGPAGAWWLRDRYEQRVPELLGHSLRSASVRDDGRVRLELNAPGGGTRSLDTGHVVAATGFVPELDRLGLLDPGLRQALRRAGTGRAPALTPRFESSCPGLFFAGLLTAPTFGPAMRFVYGTGFTADRLVAGVRRRLRR